VNFVLVYLLPSILGLKLFIYFNKDYKLLDISIYYLLFILFSNYISFIILIIFKWGEYNLLEYSSTNFVFCVKYMTILLFVNIILAILFTIIKKYFTFTIEVENARIKNKKNK